MGGNNLKNSNVANFDEYQMHQLAFDAEKEAFRFTLVDGLDLSNAHINLPDFKFPEQKPLVIKELQVQEVRIPEIIREQKIERIEVPVIVKEIQTITIEKPVYLTEVKIIEIEKPIYIKEIEYKVIEQKISEMPMIAKVCMIVQALALIGMLLTKAL